MKKILCTAVSALALAAFADGVNSTEFGVLKVPSTAKQTIVGVPWTESGTGTSDVAVSNLVLTAGLTPGDTLDLYNPSTGMYTDSWQLSDDYVWEGASTKVTIKRGSALRLTRTAQTITDGFYIMGKPSTAEGSVTMTLPSSEGTKAFTLIALPYATDTSPNDSKLTWTGIDGQYDSIIMQSSDGKTSTTYGYKNSQGKWKRWTGTTWEDAPALSAGMGMWFVTSSKEKAKSVSWKAE